MRSSSSGGGGDDGARGGGGDRLQPHTVYLNDSSAIRGYKRVASGRSVWRYLGVPYAQAPVGRLRFKPPRSLTAPVGSAGRPFEAKRKPNTCYYWPLAPVEFEVKNPALRLWWNNTEMSEDCLYLNVWTPTTSNLAKKAVMVWIYGGGFYGGSSSLQVYDGEVLAAKGDVVVVSMQYRMGALGFLHLDDYEAPGNIGLYDQLEAMKWVKRNIRQFGGDPDNITLFGESAGGVSVSYHMLSPYSQSYFNRAIMHSGTAIAWWASEERAMARQRALHLANRVGCYIGHRDYARIVACLQSIDVLKLQRMTTEVLSLYNAARSQYYDSYWRRGNGGAKKPDVETFMYFDLPFKPVYGTDFIPHDPMLILAKGNVKKTDVLMGVMKDEGIFWIVYALQALFTYTGNWTMPFWWQRPLDAVSKQRLVSLLNRGKLQTVHAERDPYELVARYFITSVNINNPLTEAISFEYQVPSTRFGDRSWKPQDVVDAFDDLTGDRSFKCPVIDFADAYLDLLQQNRLNRHQVWLYSFERRTKNLPLPVWAGAMHGYEMEYVFGMPFNDNFTNNFYTFTREEGVLSDEVMKYWTNFAKTGNPNTDDVSRRDTDNSRGWPALTQRERKHIVLDVKTGVSPQVGSHLRRRQCRFWSHHINNIRAYLKNSARICKNRTETGGTKGGSHAAAGSVGLLALAVALVFGASQ